MPQTGTGFKPPLQSLGRRKLERADPFHPYASALSTDWMLSEDSQNYLALRSCGKRIGRAERPYSSAPRISVAMEDALIAAGNPP